MIGGVVVDASALADLAAGETRRAATILDYAIRTMRVVVVPTTALLECWAREPEHSQAFLAMFPALPVVVIDDLDLDTAVDAGVAAAEAGVSVSSAVMHAVQAATRRGWPILAGMPDEVRALAPAMIIESSR